MKKNLFFILIEISKIGHYILIITLNTHNFYTKNII